MNYRGIKRSVTRERGTIFKERDGDEDGRDAVKAGTKEERG